MLKEIFNSITPENLKNIPLMEDAMDIFIETLEEKCQVSQDIKKIFEPENVAAREEFIKIYLDDLYRYLTKAKTDPLISNKIDKVNDLYGVEVIPRDFIGDLTKLFNDEHFVTSKAFKQKKGTKVGIEYIYNLVEGMIDGIQEQSSFVFEEGEVPFHFTVEGSMYKEIYDGIVKPLAHPLGFTYVYLQVIKLALQDYYQIEYSYKDVVVEVRCLEGTTDVYDGNEVKDINESVDSIGVRTTRVTFNDDTYLEQTTDPIHVTYYDFDGSILKDYTGHCSMYLTYELVVNILTSDAISTEESKEVDDNYWLDYGNPTVIGGITIGTFSIGGYAGYTMPEILEFNVDFQPTLEETTYGVLVDYLGFQIGTTGIGLEPEHNIFIGGGYEYITVDTTEVYDPRVELDEDFTIELV